MKEYAWFISECNYFLKDYVILPAPQNPLLSKGRKKERKKTQKGFSVLKTM